MQSHVPDAGRGVGALSAMKAGETIQARMLPRRFPPEMRHGCSMTGYFPMSDFAHYGDAASATFRYGLIRREDGTPKPAYQAFQALATLFP